jgi:flagellar export protein FliJ
MFVFTLQPLLDHCRHVEEAARARFSACRRAHDAAAQRLGVLEQRLLRLGAETSLAAWLQCSAGSVETQRRHVAGCRLRWEVARRELVAAGAARKVVETLCDRRYAAYQLEMRRRRESELDDANALVRQQQRFDGTAHASKGTSKMKDAMQ